jgi:hypothetical protein
MGLEKRVGIREGEFFQGATVSVSGFWLNRVLNENGNWPSLNCSMGLFSDRHALRDRHDLSIFGDPEGKRWTPYGTWQGFQCAIYRYVDDKLTVVAFANLAGTNLEKIIRAVTAIYNPALSP